MFTEIHWISAPGHGGLAIMARPRGGDWLPGEIDTSRDAGLQAVVSLLETHEVVELDLIDEERICADVGIEFLSFPITDRGTPRSEEKTNDFLQALSEMIRAGKSVAIHCRAGIGRSSLVAASVLKFFNVECELAVKLISDARRVRVPDTDEQYQWIKAFRTT